jgi:hypothetical protein
MPPIGVERELRERVDFALVAHVGRSGGDLAAEFAHQARRFGQVVLDVRDDDVGACHGECERALPSDSVAAPVITAVRPARLKADSSSGCMRND